METILYCTYALLISILKETLNRGMVMDNTKFINELKKELKKLTFEDSTDDKIKVMNQIRAIVETLKAYDAISILDGFSEEEFLERFKTECPDIFKAQ